MHGGRGNAHDWRLVRVVAQRGNEPHPSDPKVHLDLWEELYALPELTESNRGGVQGVERGLPFELTEEPFCGL